MRWILKLIFLLLLISTPTYAQVELFCPAGSNPVGSPDSVTFNLTTSKYRQVICVDALGNLIINGGTGTSIGAFRYRADDVSGLTCNIHHPCDTLNTIDAAHDSGLTVFSGDGFSEAVMMAESDSTLNTFQLHNNFFSFMSNVLSPTVQGYTATEFAGGTTTGGNCFMTGAASPPCGIGYMAIIGDNNNTSSGGQDAVAFNVLPVFRHVNLNNFAGFAVLTPEGCIQFITFPCGGAAASHPSRFWGIELQDMQGVGTIATAGIHIESQTNPAAGNLAIKVESGGGPSSFDGTATSVNCQLGGATGTTSPAACTTATAGMIAIPASQTTYTVNTTKVTANSEIFLQQMTDNSGISTATCNAGVTAPLQSARVAGTSFTFTLTSVASVTCVKWWIIN